MATNMEKSCERKRLPKARVTRRLNGKDGGLCRRKALALLQLFELILALPAMMIGVHACAKDFPQGKVPIITGGLTLLFVTIEVYVEHIEPAVFNHWITIGLDIGLVLLWAIWPMVGIGNPRYYSAPQVHHYTDHYVSYISIIVLSIIEVAILIGHIGVRAHQVCMEKQEKNSLVDLSQGQPVVRVGGQRMELDDSVHGSPEQNARREYPSHKTTNTEREAAHPPGHRLREFSPEAIYQLSLQMAEEEQGHSREMQDIAGSQSQSSLIAARKATDPPYKITERIHSQAPPKDFRTVGKAKFPSWPVNTPYLENKTPGESQIDPVRDSDLPVQQAELPLGKLFGYPSNSAELQDERTTVPRIVVEPATPVVEPPLRPITPTSDQTRCGCVDGTDEMETKVDRNGKSPCFDNGIHPLRMNPYSTKRDSPLREVESVSDDWDSDN